MWYSFSCRKFIYQRLVKKGYKVAICEQLEDPSSAKGLVDRGIIKIITPGTYMDATMDAKSTNYMASCDVSSFEITVIYCELSTGELKYKRYKDLWWRYKRLFWNKM